MQPFQQFPADTVQLANGQYQCAIQLIAQVSQCKGRAAKTAQVLAEFPCRQRRGTRELEHHGGCHRDRITDSAKRLKKERFTSASAHSQVHGLGMPCGEVARKALPEGGIQRGIIGFPNAVAWLEPCVIQPVVLDIDRRRRPRTS